MNQRGNEERADPRIYLAAERTYLAWIRTAIALIAFGFVVARFGAFLRGIALAEAADAGPDPAASLALGLGLIGVGTALCLISAVRHRRYVQAIDEGRFRSAFGSNVAFGLAALLALTGLAMVLFLATG